MHAAHPSHILIPQLELLIASPAKLLIVCVFFSVLAINESGVQMRRDGHTYARVSILAGSRCRSTCVMADAVLPRTVIDSGAEVTVSDASLLMYPNEIITRPFCSSAEQPVS